MGGRFLGGSPVFGERGLPTWSDEAETRVGDGLPSNEE